MNAVNLPSLSRGRTDVGMSAATKERAADGSVTFWVPWTMSIARVEGPYAPLCAATGILGVTTLQEIMQLQPSTRIKMGRLRGIS